MRIDATSDSTDETWGSFDAILACIGETPVRFGEYRMSIEERFGSLDETPDRYGESSMRFEETSVRFGETKGGFCRHSSMRRSRKVNSERVAASSKAF